MADSPRTPQTLPEWELPNHQRGLVDDIIEEGQYEAAIEALFQLRSPQYKPSMQVAFVASLCGSSSRTHIQQLVFLALHLAETAPATSDARPVTETPRKTRFARIPSSISPKAIVSAQSLLTSLISTNSPEALGRALPSYASDGSSKSSEEPLDSLLAKQSLCVKTAKHCWELLEEAFVYRNQVALSPKGKSKMRHDFSIEEVILSESPSREPGVVADEAWPFLGWLVSLFEKDEVFEFQTEHVRYSALFLDQLPPPRGGSITRWDFAVILNIIMYCTEQKELRRQQMGYRLMKLLINLTNTIYVEMSTLVNSVYRSLLAAWSDPRRIQDFLSDLGSATSVQRFRLYFFQKLLNDVSIPATSLHQGPMRPRPQARVAPKPRGANSVAVPKDPSSSDSSITLSKSSNQAIPTCAEILACLDLPLPPFLTSPIDLKLILFARFHLVSDFAALKDHQTPELRLEWDRLIQAESLAGSLKRGFPPELGDEASVYLEMLQESLRVPL